MTGAAIVEFLPFSGLSASTGYYVDVMGLIAKAAASLPARRALRIDPVTALRAD